MILTAENGVDARHEEITRAAAAWAKFFVQSDLEALKLAAGDPEITPEGDIYPITPDSKLGLVGDCALVDMGQIRVDTPHRHKSPELEAHIPLLGSAVMSIGDRVVDMTSGRLAEVVPLETPHFIVPGRRGYLVAVVNFPDFDPNRQIPVNTTNPPADFNAGLYTAAVGSQQPAL